MELNPGGSWTLSRPISARHRCSPGVTSASARALANAARSLYSAHAGPTARFARCPARRRGSGYLYLYMCMHGQLPLPPARAFLRTCSLLTCVLDFVRGSNNYIAILLQTIPFPLRLTHSLLPFPTLLCRALASSSATPPTPAANSLHHHQ